MSQLENHGSMRTIEARFVGRRVVKPPGGGTWGDNLPANFSWLAVNMMAGSACPQSELELRSLAGLGISHLVTLSPDAKPPDCITHIQDIQWTVIPIQNLHGAKIEQFYTFFNICDQHLGDKVNGGAILIHCMGGRGRTGMFLAAYLMRYNGLSAKASIAAVRAARPGSIETKSQEESLIKLEDFLQQQKQKNPLKATAEI